QGARRRRHPGKPGQPGGVEGSRVVGAGPGGAGPPRRTPGRAVAAQRPATVLPATLPGRRARAARAMTPIVADSHSGLIRPGQDGKRPPWSARNRKQVPMRYEAPGTIEDAIALLGREAG